MNMISTGAFLNEMDASNKQPTAAEKFAAVWEKKNAKAARAGGVSLMALSLAACGSSSSTTETDTSTDTTTTTPAASAHSLNVATTPDSLTLTAGNDTVDAKTANSFGDKADVVVDASTTDSDTIDVFITASPTAGSLIQNVETVNLTLGGSATITGMITGQDVINVSSSSAANTLTIASVADGTDINIVGTTVYGADSKAANLTVDAASGATTLDLGVSAGGSTSLDIDGATQTEFKVVNIESTGGTANTVAIATGTSREQAGDKIVVTGDTALTIKADLADMGAATSGSVVETTIDASDATGEVTYHAQDANSANFILDMTKFTGVDKVILGTASNKAIHTTFKLDDMADGQTLELQNYANATSDDLTMELATATSLTDSATLIMNDKAGTADLDFDDLTVTGINNVTINSTGKLATAAAVPVTLYNEVNDIITTTTASTLNITGDKGFKVEGSVDELFTTINASDSTGGVNLVMADVAANTTFTGGAGADRIDMNTKLTYQDNLDGGDGKDTLVIGGVAADTASTSVLTSTATTGNVNGFANFEVLELNDALNIKGGGGDVTVDLTKEAGMNELKLSAQVDVDTNDTFTVVAESGFTLELEASGQTIDDDTSEDNFIISISGAQAAGTDDVVNLVLDNGTGAVTEDGFSIDGVETLNITQKDAHASNVDTIADIHGAQLQTITISGAKSSASVVAQGITISDLETTVLTTINASDFLGGALDISGLDNNFSAAGATITAGLGALTANGGVGSDTITGSAAGDTIFGKNGLDTIDGGAGADTLIGDGGNGTFEAVTSVVGSGDFSATTDTLSVTIFGKTFTATATGTTAANTPIEVAEDLKDAIEADAVVSKLVTASSGSSGSDASITVTSKIDGNFTDFDVAVAGGGALSGETATNGTASGDGVDTITAGAGADFIAGGKGADIITLGSDQEADTVVITSGGLGDKITGFEAGDGTDVIRFADELTSNGTAAATLSSISSSGTIGANDSYIEITTATAAGGADTAAEIASHLSSVTQTNVTNGEKVMFAVNDGTDMYIWQWTEDGTDGIQADDLAIAAILYGVTDIANGDLAFL